MYGYRKAVGTAEIQRLSHKGYRVLQVAREEVVAGGPKCWVAFMEKHYPQPFCREGARLMAKEIEKDLEEEAECNDV